MNAKSFMKAVTGFILLMSPIMSWPVVAETMVWGTTSFPPGYITEGAEKGRGYADKLDRFMMDKLPQYDHEIVNFPIGKDTCA